jgi:ribonuclease HI
MAAPFRVAFDGGSRGNPGIAAWGVAVLDDDGGFVEGFGGLIGNANNNVAEYNGLIEALKLAGEHGATEVEVFADSELIVKHVQGSYRVKNAGLLPLFVEAMRMIQAFDAFSITHVRRESNKDADRMVNRTLDLAVAAPDNPSIRVHEKGTCTESGFRGHLD